MIGLETHVELGTRTKMFCGCTTTFGAEPNSQACPVCLGLPGSLPVVNRTAIEYTIRIGLALNCSIAEWCRFARKNYFYPDMPKNFQISQYDEPLCTDGYLDVEVDGKTVRVGIERVHLEEDTGKSLHVGGATGRIHGAEYSLVDYNRAGIPLVEIVTKPVTGTGADAPVAARLYVTELRDLLRSLGVSDVRMEEGSLRCDVNTSLAPRGASQWGTRTETKNVNSLRSVERAVHFEIERQAAVLDARRPGHPGDQALPRGHRHHHLRPVQGRGPGLPLLPRARPGAGRPAAGLGGADPRLPARGAGRAPRPAAGRVGRVRAGHDRASSTPARSTWSGRRSRRARRRPTPASGGWASCPGAPTTPAPNWPPSRSPRRRSPGSPRWSRRARSTTSWPAQVIDAVLAGEGDPDEVVEARGLAVVSDDGALTAAVDEAIAANPTWRPRSATARSPRPASWSARS